MPLLYKLSFIIMIIVILMSFADPLLLFRHKINRAFPSGSPSYEWSRVKVISFVHKRFLN